MNFNELCLGKPRRFRVKPRKGINSEKSNSVILVKRV